MTCISTRQWDTKKAQGWSLNYLNGCWVEITEDSGHPSLSKPAAQSARLRRRRARGDVDNDRNVATTQKPENKSGERAESAERSGHSDSDLQRGERASRPVFRMERCRSRWLRLELRRPLLATKGSVTYPPSPWRCPARL